MQLLVKVNRNCISVLIKEVLKQEKSKLIKSKKKWIEGWQTHLIIDRENYYDYIERSGTDDDIDNKIASLTSQIEEFDRYFESDEYLELPEIIMCKNEEEIREVRKREEETRKFLNQNDNDSIDPAVFAETKEYFEGLKKIK